MKRIDDVIAHSRVTRISTPGSAHRVCPSCSSADILIVERSSTLLGGGDGSEDGDPNHRTQSCRCRACDSGFERHARYANVWYVDPVTRVLLTGVATCFENFNYPCQCGGVIRRRYTRLDGTTDTVSLGWSRDAGKNYRVFWKCDTCSFDVETAEDYA